VIDAALSLRYFGRHVWRHATPLTDRATWSIGGWKPQSIRQHAKL